MKKLYRVILILIVFIFVSTYSPHKLESFSKKKNIFFKIKKIEIINNSLIKEDEILEKLSSIYNKNILTIKRNEIEEPLKTFDFFNKIEVKKKYPNTIIISVYETKPIAILFKNKIKYLLDNSSRLIFFKNDVNLEGIPNVFGEGAEYEFLKLFNQLENNNFPQKRIKNYYYHKIGRWDLEFFNNKIIKLPHEKILKAIKKSVELLNRKDFKNYNIIDLRIDGKIIVE